ncbi:MAG: ornithine carbamoyltransferase [Chloroflexi bacterium]|nr:ornithine carbamoyltransferase [Chloroflexota bacterium]
MTARPKVRHFLSMADLTSVEIGQVLARAAEFKRGKRSGCLFGKTAVLLFEKPSLRTKLSFDTAVHALGGHPIYFSPQEVGLNKREPVADVSRVISTMADIAIVRTFLHSTLEEFARASSVSVINALSDLEHPCQVLADLLTIEEHKGAYKGLRIAYIGDGNNVAVSLALGIALMGGELVIASPKGYELPGGVASRARQIGTRTGGALALVSTPEEAARGADIVYTDVWTSMGQEQETAQRVVAFKGYQVNPQLLKLAKPDVKFMHDMPAHPGEEVSPGMFDDPRSIVFDQAANRLHAQAGLLDFLFA